MKACQRLIASFVLLLPGSAWSVDWAAVLAEHYLDGKPVEVFASDMSLEEATVVQERFFARLGATLGPVVGYKAGLTNPALQKRFGVSHPLLGVLLEKMLLKSGAVLPAAFGAVPMSEGDLLVRVVSERINRASTPEEALAGIDAVIPFIELPDLLYGKGVRVSAAALEAVGVAARYGILGEPIAIQPTPAWRERLRNFELLILDAQGRTLARGTGVNLLGDPLRAVLWIKDALAAKGKRLRAGDLLSLGTVTKLMPVAANTTLRARYIGLDPAGPVEVCVQFR